MTAGGPTASLRRELGLLPIAAVIFFNVSGGPYGIEDAVASFGLEGAGIAALATREAVERRLGERSPDLSHK